MTAINLLAFINLYHITQHWNHQDLTSYTVDAICLRWSYQNAKADLLHISM